MFELFADSTPNARKISIMLEEINENYSITFINLNKGEQFHEDFKKISPFSKIPVPVSYTHLTLPTICSV